MTSPAEARKAGHSTTTRAEQPLTWLLGFAPLEHAARVALALPFLVSGVLKATDFAGAVAEVAGLGLSPPVPFAVAVIATQLIGSALFLTPRWCWLGAGLLAGFTAIATLIAHPFWAVSGVDGARQTATFLEHVALIGGFAAAAILAHRKPAP